MDHYVPLLRFQVTLMKEQNLQLSRQFAYQIILGEGSFLSVFRCFSLILFTFTATRINSEHEQSPEQTIISIVETHE